MKFKLGQLMLTRGVNDLVAQDSLFSQYVFRSMKRHACGDWGELCDEGRVSNEIAIQEGGRLFSVYKEEGLPTIWIITEWDRSLTTGAAPVFLDTDLG